MGIKIEITGDSAIDVMGQAISFGVRCMESWDAVQIGKELFDKDNARLADSRNPGDITVMEACEVLLGRDLASFGRHAQRLAEERTARQAAAQPPAQDAEQKPEKGKAAESGKAARGKAKESSGAEAQEAGAAHAEESGPPAQTYTLEDVRKVAVPLARKHGNAAVKAILTELGAAGMGKLDPAQYPVFLEKLAELDKQEAENA